MHHIENSLQFYESNRPPIFFAWVCSKEFVFVRFSNGNSREWAIDRAGRVDLGRVNPQVFRLIGV